MSATGLFTLTSGQIKFPATAVPSADPNTIDDYEEGTYTVTITAATSGTVTLKTTADLGSYTKVGRVVHIGGQITIASVSSPVGYALIIAPFTSVSLADKAHYSAGTVGFTLVNFTGGNWVFPRISGGSSGFNLISVTDNGTWVKEHASIFSANDEMTFQLTYFTE